MPRTWSVVAPFFYSGPSDQWIDNHVHDDRWAFQKIARAPSRDNWHARSKRATGLTTWIDYWKQSRRAFPASGVITVFPQLALTAAAQKQLFRWNVPIIAWTFNLGQFPGGWKRAAARTLLRGVDRIIVHSTGEVDRVSEFLDARPGTVEFVPLQRAPIPIEASEDTRSPFIVAMGSANRDYETFFKAAELTGLPCKVVASPLSIEGLRIPDNVSVESGLDYSACHRLVQRSRFSVVPLLDPEIASGQVTVIESMRMNRAVISTESIGTTDYIRTGLSGVLVPPQDPQALAQAMLELWEDQSLRGAYADKARRFAETSLSDAAAAAALTRIMSAVELQG
jgi:glycosyltransferase involved in cell wall biosynthesis